jgi:hypothetical protein
LDAGRRHRFAAKRIARNASQQRIGADVSVATGLCEFIGRAAAPTFFWGGEAAKATGSVIAARLFLMGVWRDSTQPRLEETGGVGNCKRSREIENRRLAPPWNCLLA